VIGKFCALGTGVRFIMNGANHRMDGVSTFPFPIMGEPWSDHFDLIVGLPVRGDTVVGHDVWLGYQTIVMPGVHIGTGTIVASGSVVVDDLPPYAIAGGNPAKVIRRRFNSADIERALAIAWWDWPLGLISENVRAIMAGSLDDLEAVRR
jgi:virginiamycin A acetyltransferase